MRSSAIAVAAAVVALLLVPSRTRADQQPAPPWDYATSFSTQGSCTKTATLVCSYTTSQEGSHELLQGGYSGAVNFKSSGVETATSTGRLEAVYLAFDSLPKTVRRATYTAHLVHDCRAEPPFMSGAARIGGRIKVQVYSRAVKDEVWETPFTSSPCPTAATESIFLVITPRKGNYLPAGTYLIQVVRYLEAEVDAGFAGEGTYSEAVPLGGTRLTRS